MKRNHNDVFVTRKPGSNRPDAPALEFPHKEEEEEESAPRPEPTIATSGTSTLAGVPDPEELKAARAEVARLTSERDEERARSIRHEKERLAEAYEQKTSLAAARADAEKASLWRLAVDEALLTWSMSANDDPRESVKRLVEMEVRAALDPACSAQAAEMHARAEKAEQALRDAQTEVAQLKTEVAQLKANREAAVKSKNDAYSDLKDAYSDLTGFIAKVDTAIGGPGTRAPEVVLAEAERLQRSEAATRERCLQLAEEMRLLQQNAPKDDAGEPSPLLQAAQAFVADPTERAYLALEAGAREIRSKAQAHKSKR